MKRDSCYGWLVVAAALLCQTILGGICLTGGLFYIIFREAFNMSPVETSWLCSLPITLWFMAAPLGSVLINRYGYRVSGFLGGVLAALGLCLSFFAQNATFLFFSHGILTGLGLGINYICCTTAVSDYFDKYRTIATGTITIGHQLGLVIFSSLILYLKTTYGWRGAMLVLGSITFHLCACSLLMKPFCEKHVNKSNTAKPIMNVSVLKKTSFLCLCVSNLFLNFSQGIYILHLPSYAKIIGFTGSDVALVLTVYGSVLIVGKVFFNVLGNHQSVDETILYAVSLAFCAVFMALTPVFPTREGMLVLPGFVAFFFCVTGSLAAAILFRIVGQDRFADGAGMSIPFKATGNLIGGPVAGVMYSATENYASSFYLAGVTMFLSAFVLIHPILYHRRRERLHTKPNRFLVAEGEITLDNTTALITPPSASSEREEKSDTVLSFSLPKAES